MDSEIDRLLALAAQIPPDGREEFLARQCPDPAIRAEVESLLQFITGSETYFEEAVQSVAISLRSSSELSPGDAIGSYRIVSMIGRGGMGIVYLAERADGEIQHKVAVKLLRSDSNLIVWRHRFLQERQLLASLQHPSIVHVIDAGHVGDGRPYLVMEHIEGTSIDQYAAQLDLRGQLNLFLLVCDGVSHAHRRLIVHRDLKPSNILVDSSGHPKLLDFGIAKLLDAATSETHTVERLLTPNYASPEQLRGDVQTTATDIYSLGAVLHKLVTGRSPREAVDGVRLANPVPSQLNPKLPRDIDHILRKALHEEPEERYASVDAFADDLRAFLDFRPVQARSAGAWYRTRKFLRRYWVTTSAAAVTVVGLSLSLYVANRERSMAERRFQQIRQLANNVLSLDTVVGALPGSTKARHEIVAMSKEYLESLAPNARGDRELALELGIAYARLARAQGVPGAQNLGQYTQAEDSLHKAEALIEPVLAASPRNRQALLTLAGTSQGLMTLARQAGLRDEALAHAHKAVRNLDLFLGLGTPPPPEAREASRILYSIALAYRNMHLHEDAIQYARRSAEVARSLPAGEGSRADGFSLLADLTRISGDPEGAHQAIREARASLEGTDYTSDPRRRSSWFLVLWREGVILGGGNGPSLNRPEEAIAVLQQALDVIEAWAQSDPNDASIRIYFDQTARELGAILRDQEPERALRVYDLALRRLGEVKDNPRARQGEAGMLAGSSYALRRMGRPSDAKKRIDASFRLLRETKDYPADRIDTDSEVEPALRALADHYADTGQPVRAAEVYQQLLDLILAAQPDSESDLRRAAKLSRIYEALAVLHRRNHQPARADAISALRRTLWAQWNHRLPNNGYVRRQLQAAGG